MSVFLSWSGEYSAQFAAILEEYIPLFVPGANVFYSSKIPAGSRSFRAIDEALRTCTYGILCLTPDNVNAPWILYEAGAISNVWLNTSEPEQFINVTPLLFGGLTPSTLKPPLGNFQTREPNRDGIYDVMLGITESLGGDSVDDRAFERRFARLWTQFNSKLQLVTRPLDAPQGRARSERDMLSEVLDILRAQQRQFVVSGGDKYGASTVDAVRRRKLQELHDEGVVRLIADRALRAGRSVETSAGAAIIVGDTVIEVRVRDFRVPRYAVRLEQVVKQARSLAEKLGKRSYLVVLSGRPDFGVVKSLSRPVALVFFDGERFTGNGEAHQLVPWLLDATWLIEG